MSQRRKLREHMHQLTEIRDIMDAMKNLALIETRKLAGILENQRLLRNTLERVAADFLNFYSYTEIAEEDSRACWIIFGSERGFCGDFNESLLQLLDSQTGSGSRDPLLLIPVGSKLCMKLEDDPRVVEFIQGADVREEINPVLTSLITHLNGLHKRYDRLTVFALYHDAETEAISQTQLLPPFKTAPAGDAGHSFPPLLYIPPERFFTALVDRYLFVALQEISYTSLMAESDKRIQHMTGAVQRLDEKTGDLMRKYHIRRQEEITEELEVILLNVTQGSPDLIDRR